MIHCVRNHLRQVTIKGSKYAWQLFYMEGNNKMPNDYFPHISQSLIGKTIRMNCIPLYNPNWFPINVAPKCNNYPILIFLFLASRSISITLVVRMLGFIWDMG